MLALWQRVIAVLFQEFLESHSESERWFDGSKEMYGCLSANEDVEDSMDVLVLPRLEVDDVSVFPHDRHESFEFLAS